MQALFRTSRIAARTTHLLPRSVRPYATESYGSESQSGHPKSDAPNPKEDAEHPGPKAPADKGTAKGEASGSSQPSKADQGSPSGGSDSASTGSKNGSKPTLVNPDKAWTSQEQNADVKKHNEEMDKRSDKAVNRLDVKGQVMDDENVEKGFWKGK